MIFGDRITPCAVSTQVNGIQLPTDTSLGKLETCLFADLDDAERLSSGNGQLLEIKHIYGEDETHHAACSGFSGLKCGYSQSVQKNRSHLNRSGYTGAI